MKNRKVLALIMAFAMIFTLIPGAAFAGSTNSVDRVTTVAPDSEIPDVRLQLTINNTAQDPVQVFKLSLTNATWGMDDPTTDGIITTGAIASGSGYGNGPSIAVSLSTGAAMTARALSVSDTTVEIEIDTDAYQFIKDDVITLMLKLHAEDEAGEVKVAIDALDSHLTSGSYTVAVVGSGSTTATVLNDTVGSTWRTGSFTANTVEIRENSVNAIDASTVQRLKLTLPTGVNWVGITSGGSMVTTTQVAFSGTNGSYEGSGGTGTRDLFIDVAPTANGNIREMLTLTPIIQVTKDAKLGDITLTIRNQTSLSTGTFSNASGLVIAQYVEENVKVTTEKEADLPEIVAGREDGDYEVVVIVEEIINSALASGRFIEFEFPEYVQIPSGSGVEADFKSGSNSGRKDDAANGPRVSGSAWDNAVGDVDEDTSSFEYTLPDNMSTLTKDKIEFTIPVTIEPGTPSGDLTVKVSGGKAGVPDTELVVGKILAPITSEVKMADIRAGIQKQSLGEITIKENFAGALIDGNDLVLNLVNDINGSFKDADATVVSGDIELGKVDVDGHVITIPIKNESVSSAAEIKISGVTFSVDRTPAEGKYKLRIGGDALVTNSSSSIGGKLNYRDDDFTSWAVSTDYINVITLADANLYGESKFVIGASTYTAYINGELQEFPLDAPPYIDPAGRTMVSVKFAANSLGVPDQSIVWDANSKTATIFKGDRVVVFKSASNEIIVNGATIKMDVACANVNGRLFVPIAHLANALGTAYTWDDAERSVTLLNK